MKCPQCGTDNRAGARYCTDCGTLLAPAGGLAAGSVLQNRYRILRKLDSGGMGAVYQVEQTQLHQRLALKEIHEILLADPNERAEAVRQFQNEARILSQLSHPNLPRVSDFFEENGQLYLVMDFIEGETLAQRQARMAGHFSEKQVIEWGIQICEVLEYLHSQHPPVIFRDIKPANVMIDWQGQVKLIDFGIAKLFNPARQTDTLKMGTPGYASPEHYGGKGGTDARSDLYSLGATLHHLLTRNDPAAEAPFYFSNAPVKKYNPTVSAQLEAVIARATQYERSKRFQTAAEMKKALQSCLATRSIPAPLALPQVQARPALGFLITALIVLATGTGAWLAIRPKPEIITPIPPALRDTSGDKAAIPTAAALLETGSGTPLAGESPTPLLTPSPTPDFPLVTGSREVSEMDGMPLVAVPAGRFLMGAADSITEADEDERPQHAVYLDAFRIDQTEVTNRMFDRFVSATGYRTQAEKDGWGYVLNGATRKWEQISGANWRHPGGPRSNILEKENYPVVQTSWEDAAAYCRWAGRRLPTEAEWEKAARGTKGLLYPWGNAPPEGTFLNFCDRNCVFDWKAPSIDDGYPWIAPVGSYPEGASPYGALDMAGNVWEWVADWYERSYYRFYVKSPYANPQGPLQGEFRGLRGGSWTSASERVRTAFRLGDKPERRYDYTGFRCAQ